MEEANALLNAFSRVAIAAGLYLSSLLFIPVVVATELIELKRRKTPQLQKAYLDVRSFQSVADISLDVDFDDNTDYVVTPGTESDVLDAARDFVQYV